MTKVKFIYIRNIYEMINVKDELLLSDLILKYCSIINQDKNELYFLYKGKILSLDKNIKIKDLNNKNIIISIFKINYEKNSNKTILNHIICPECEDSLNLVLLNFEEDKIVLDKCKNKHETIFYSLNDFIESQKIKSKKCKKCKNKLDDYNNVLYYNSNEEYICPLCIKSGDSLINLNDKYYKCHKHNIEFKSYCRDCNINICCECEINHLRHKIISLKSIKINENKINEMKKNISEFKNLIDIYKEEIKKMNILYIDISKIIMNNIEKYADISQYILYSLDNLKNYESIKNISNINIEKLIKEINKFLNETDLCEKFNYLLNESVKIHKNSITIEYKNNNNSKVKIFDETFIRNNKDNCYIIINDKKYKIQEYCPIKVKSETIKIKLIEKKIIFNMSYMFYNCPSLLSLIDISKWNAIKVKNMSYMFYNCSSLLSIPDISKWNTINVTNMNGIFRGCSSLSILPDISKWNTNIVTDMSWMFYGCSSLLSLPDISKWNTNNVTYMIRMFSECSSLLSLPDISKWDTSNLSEIGSMFEGCPSLASLPDISKWNTKNITYFGDMFKKCSSLKSLPDISKWNTNYVSSMKGMFSECSSLSSLPDISKWITNNISDMSYMFEGCSSLLSLPDISKWNTNIVYNMSYMFKGCSSLCSLPDISKWNTNREIDMKDMFEGCLKLTSLPNILMQ